jgi:hypothetical protein
LAANVERRLIWNLVAYTDEFERVRLIGLLVRGRIGSRWWTIRVRNVFVSQSTGGSHDGHVIKFADAAADAYARTGDPAALAAAAQAAELVPARYGDDLRAR